MPEQKQTLSFLTIKKEHFDDKHFTFKVIRPSNSLITSAKVTIKRTIYKTKKLDVKEGDRLFISIQNNSEDKILIFKGTIRSMSDMGDQIYINAESRIVSNENFNETYKDSSLEKVIKMLVPETIYEAVDKIYSQLICRGKKEESLRRLLSDKHYFTNLDNYLIVRDNLKEGVTFVIDNCTYHDSVKSNSIPIVPIPKLEINDIVKYMEKHFIVRAITYHYLSKAQMVLNVEKYIKEAIPSSQKQKDDFTPFSKHAPEAYKYFENPDKLNELSDGARKHIMHMAKQVKEEMEAEGEKFERFYLTEVHRTVASQVHILSRKMRLLSGTQNMFVYYDEQITEEYFGKSASLNYLNAIQAYFDGTALETLNIKRWAKVHEDHQREIESMGQFSNAEEDKIEVTNHKGDKERKTPRTLEAERLMTKYMERYVFRPSFHMKDKGTCYLLDLRIKEDTGELGGDKEKTADRLFAKNKTYYSSCTNTLEGQKCEAGYKTTTKGDPHIHLKLLENYTPKN